MVYYAEHMKFIADFHIHSHFSIATSKILVPEYLDYWARLKGVTVVGTGDFTHPGWTAELKEKLEPAEPGLYRLKREYVREEAAHFGESGFGPRFILTAEISNIYKREGKVRKVHNLIFAPDFQTVEGIQSRLSGVGNIRSDGRPILGLDSRDLLEIALEESEKIFFVPAHIWTPWFSVLGAQSGFDTVQDCYGDLSGFIHAVETGLSSDPPMNWLCSFLDRYTLISNSDAHSPQKLGREANLFDTELSYEKIIDALKQVDRDRFLGTIEFFPQEGKYHFDGHRKCGVAWNPLETLRHDGICPVCGKKVTVGVLNRVFQRADREDWHDAGNRKQFHSLIPLKELLSEIFNAGLSSKKVEDAYHSLLRTVGSELDVLLRIPVADIKHETGDVIAEAVRRMRKGEVRITEGYDGEYGKIRVFDEKEKRTLSGQGFFFAEAGDGFPLQKPAPSGVNFSVQQYMSLRRNTARVDPTDTKSPETEARSGEEKSSADYPCRLILNGLNGEQKNAVTHADGPCLVLAGPGTGKTATLSARIVYLILCRAVPAEKVLAVTFTNRASEEMRERLRMRLSGGIDVSRIRIMTFHAFGYGLLRRFGDRFGRNERFSVINEDERTWILGRILKEGDPKRIGEEISRIKRDVREDYEIADSELKRAFSIYEKSLEDQNLFDFDDLVSLPIKLLFSSPEILDRQREYNSWICVDEYQDINRAQYTLIRLLAPSVHSHIFAVGDPNQAIYGFRGADIEFIRCFERDYTGARVYRLMKSYRCSDTILESSGQVVQARERAVQGTVQGVRIRISEHATEKSEAEYVARVIENLMGGVRFFSIDSDVSEGETEAEIESLSDFAVLCRVGSQMPAVQKALDDHGIPSQSVRDESLFTMEPVKSIIALLKLAHSKRPTPLFDRYLRTRKVTFEEVSAFYEKMGNYKTVSRGMEDFIERFFSKEREEHLLSVRRLIEYAERYEDSFEDFLEFAFIGRGQDTYEPAAEKVALMTLHAAKGLEFQCVCIVGCEEGLLPYSLFHDQKSDPEEERRLLYVGMTRARKYLYLTHSRKRFLFGKEYELERSHFLNDIEERFVELSRSVYTRPKDNAQNQLELF
jgi:DNA helicase-2/ATP-dependent DNA helicase PcrA